MAVGNGTVVVGDPVASLEMGAAYVYVRTASGWPTTPTATLADPAAASDDNFGVSVAVSKGIAVVGCPGTSSAAGATYIYVKSASAWPTTPTRL